jgi:hypothetical protein
MTIIELEQAIAVKKSELAELEARLNDAWPKIGDEVWLLHADGLIRCHSVAAASFLFSCLMRGNVFRTREEAQAEDKRRIILAGIHADAKADREKTPAHADHVRIINAAGYVVIVQPREVPYGAPYFHTYEASRASAAKWFGEGA